MSDDTETTIPPAVLPRPIEDYVDALDALVPRLTGEDARVLRDLVAGLRALSDTGALWLPDPLRTYVAALTAQADAPCRELAQWLAASGTPADPG